MEISESVLISLKESNEYELAMDKHNLVQQAFHTGNVINEQVDTLQRLIPSTLKHEDFVAVEELKGAISELLEVNEETLNEHLIPDQELVQIMYGLENYEQVIKRIEAFNKISEVGIAIADTIINNPHETRSFLEIVDND